MAVFRPATPHLMLLTLSMAAVGYLASAGAEIIDGTDAVAEELQEVFSIAVPSANGPDRLCTATLIHPRVLLTAAHCLPSNSKTVVKVKSGPDARRPTLTFSSLRTVRHAAFYAGVSETKKTGYDIGIIILATPVPRSVAAPVPLGESGGRTEMGIAASEGVFVVGFGGKNTVRVDATTGVKRWAQTKILESSSTTFSTFGAASAQSRGDSGGPAYVVDDQGYRRVIGVASGTPFARILELTGRPESSLYTAIRRSIACWIEKNSGFPLPEFPGTLTCEQKSTGEFGV